MSTREEFLEIYDERRVLAQTEWYKERAVEYRKADGEAFFLAQAMLFGAASCGVLGALDIARVPLGIAAAILAVLATFISGWASLIGFSANAKLYEHAVAGLSHVRPGRAAAATSEEAVADYVAKAEGVLLAEVRSWAEQWGNVVRATESKPAEAPGPPADTPGEARESGDTSVTPTPTADEG